MCFNLNYTGVHQFEGSPVFNHEYYVDRIPDELGVSFPIPATGREEELNRFIFFHFYMRYVEKDKFRISSPRYRSLVEYPSLKILEFERFDRSSFNLIGTDQEPPGYYYSDPNTSYEEKMEELREFFRLYEKVLAIYSSDKNPLTEEGKKVVDEFKNLFPEYFHKPLVSYYKALGNEFFLWVDNVSKVLPGDG